MRGTLMSNEEWERTREARIRLAGQMGHILWRDLTVEQADDAVRAEHDKPGAGAAVAKRFTHSESRS